MLSYRKANKRGVARLISVQALYQMDIAGTSIDETIKEYKNYIIDKEIDGQKYLSADYYWFYSIIFGFIEEQKILDPMITKVLPNTWPLSRLDSIVRAILRAGIWELKNKKDIPIAVIISEYVDIAKAFFLTEEPKFINALLDKLAKHLRK